MKTKSFLIASLTALGGLVVGVSLTPSLTRLPLAQNASTPALLSCLKQRRQHWQAMHQAVESQDFEAWKNLRQEAWKTQQQHWQQINNLIDSQKKFEKWLSARDLIRQGKTDEAKTILTELGFDSNQCLFTMGLGGFRGKGIRSRWSN